MHPVEINPDAFIPRSLFLFLAAPVCPLSLPARLSVCLRTQRAGYHSIHQLT